MDTIRSGRELRRFGLLVIAVGLVLSVTGLRGFVAALPPGIMVVLLGTVLLVVGAFQEIE